MANQISPIRRCRPWIRLAGAYWRWRRRQRTHSRRSLLFPCLKRPQIWNSSMTMAMVVIEMYGSYEGEGQESGGAAAERLCSRSGQPCRWRRGRLNRLTRRLHRFQLLNDQPKVQNVVLLQFRTDNVASRRASDAHRSHGAKGNRSQGAIGGLIVSVFLYFFSLSLSLFSSLFTFYVEEAVSCRRECLLKSTSFKSNLDHPNLAKAAR
jgi:hypothetical protein